MIVLGYRGTHRWHIPELGYVCTNVKQNFTRVFPWTQMCRNEPHILPRSCNHCCRGKKNKCYIQYHECAFVACLIQHVKCMRRVMLSFVACPDVPYFSTLYHKGTILGKNVIGHKMCVLIFSTTFLWNIPYCKKNSTRCCHMRICIIKIGTRSASQILRKLECSCQIFENTRV
jgi:hypothetical protein